MSLLKKHSLNSFENENDISRILTLKHQVSEPMTGVKNLQGKSQRSYSFLIGKQLKRLDLGSLTSSSVSTNLSSSAANSSQSVDYNGSYLFNRQAANNRSFISKGFIKTRQSLFYLFKLHIFVTVQNRKIVL